MAQYEHLSIYRKAFDLSIYLENSVRNFSKYHKYTLVSDLRNISGQIVRLIIRANSERNKVATLEKDIFKLFTNSSRLPPLKKSGWKKKNLKLLPESAKISLAENKNDGSASTMTD